MANEAWEYNRMPSSRKHLFPFGFHIAKLNFKLRDSSALEELWRAVNVRAIGGTPFRSGEDPTGVF